MKRSWDSDKRNICDESTNRSDEGNTWWNWKTWNPVVIWTISRRSHVHTELQYPNTTINIHYRPLQKSPIPLNRYDDILEEAPHVPHRDQRTPEPKIVARGLYNFVAQNARYLKRQKCHAYSNELDYIFVLGNCLFKRVTSYLFVDKSTKIGTRANTMQWSASFPSIMSR